MKPPLLRPASRLILGVGLAVLAAMAPAQLSTGGLIVRSNFLATGFGESVTSIAPPVRIAGGFNHVSALRADGTVVVWGDDDAKQCQVPLGLVGVTQIASGSRHTVALKADKTVVQWGDYWTSEPPATLRAVQVSAGDSFNVALKVDGTLEAWGSNPDSRLNIPAGLTGVTQIASSGTHSIALKSDGTVVTFGDYDDKVLLTPPVGLKGVTQVAAGNRHNLALLKDGTVVAWGNNSNGQSTVPFGLTNVVRIAAGYTSSLALKSDGTVVAWGSNAKLPAGLTGVTQITAGYKFGCALKSDESIVVWGDDISSVGQIPLGLRSVVQVSSYGNHLLALNANGTVVGRGPNVKGELTIPAGLKDVVQVAAGGTHSVVLRANGTILAWGSNTYKQLAIPAGLTNVTQISAGENHTVALKADGTVVAWGDNNYKQLAIPAGLKDVVQVAAARDCTLAVKSDGTVVGWGTSGVLTLPPALAGVVRVANDGVAAFGLRSDGVVSGWGSGASASVPSLLSGVVQIMAGSPRGFAYARKSDGTVVGWGGQQGGGISLPLAPNGMDQTVDFNFTESENQTPESRAILLAAGLVADRWVINQGATVNATLSVPTAPKVDTDIPIFSSSDLVQVPTVVKIAAGTRSATFAISSPSTFEGTAVISAKYQGANPMTTVTVRAPVSANLTIDPTSLKGGSSALATVKLSTGVAPAGGTIVPLTSNQTSATVPASVTILAGNSSASFKVDTSAVTVDTTATITAKLGLALRSASFIIRAPLLSTLGLGVTTVKAGTSVTGTVTLDGPAPKEGVSVALTSNQAFAKVPATLLIVGGNKSADFTVSTSGVVNTTSATITAKYGNVSRTATLSVTPATPVLTEVSLDQSSVRGEDLVIGTVRLDVNAPSGGLTVSLKSNNAAATVPATVVIPAGKSVATFEIATDPVATEQKVTITSTLGANTKTVSLTITPPALEFVAVTTSRIKGGTATSGMALIDSPAPAGGIKVTLTSSDPNLTVPATVTIPEGGFFANFAITSKVVKATTRVTLTAVYGGVTKKVVITLTP